MKTIKINDLADLKKAMEEKKGLVTRPCVQCSKELTGCDPNEDAPIFDECYQTVCKTCGGAGGYYEDVAGDGGSRMFMPCEDCDYEDNN